jgi:hypothetical protein
MIPFSISDGSLTSKRISSGPLCGEVTGVTNPLSTFSAIIPAMLTGSLPIRTEARSKVPSRLDLVLEAFPLSQ